MTNNLLSSKDNVVPVKMSPVWIKHFKFDQKYKDIFHEFNNFEEHAI